MTEATPPRILIEREDGYVTLVFNSPDRMNPLDVDVLRELNVLVPQLAAEPGVRAIVFTGSGRAFSAGGDLEKYLTLFRRPDEFRAFMESFYTLFEFMEASDKIYIAAINGVCVAGGIELLLACDLVIADENARIADGHVNFCQLPGAGSSVRAWRSIGAIRAKHLLLTGDFLTAGEALAVGLVGEVTPAGELAAGVRALVGKLKAKSPVAIGGMKALLNEAVRSDVDRALRNEISFVHRYATTEADPIEGLLAFKEKREPRYGQGR